MAGDDNNLYETMLRRRARFAILLVAFVVGGGYLYFRESSREPERPKIVRQFPKQKGTAPAAVGMERAKVPLSIALNAPAIESPKFNESAERLANLIRNDNLCELYQFLGDLKTRPLQREEMALVVGAFLKSDMNGISFDAEEINILEVLQDMDLKKSNAGSPVTSVFAALSVTRSNPYINGNPEGNGIGSAGTFYKIQSRKFPGNGANYLFQAVADAKVFEPSDSSVDEAISEALAAPEFSTGYDQINERLLAKAATNATSLLLMRSVLASLATPNALDVVPVLKRFANKNAENFRMVQAWAKQRRADLLADPTGHTTGRADWVEFQIGTAILKELQLSGRMPASERISNEELFPAEIFLNPLRKIEVDLKNSLPSNESEINNCDRDLADDYLREFRRALGN